MTGRTAAMAVWMFLAAAAQHAVDAAAEDRGGAKFQDVVVKPGDTLWGIANRYLKDPTRWNEILRYNGALTSDPTVALPGMTLRVPVTLIKEELRAALLIEVVSQVLSRPKENPEWKTARLGMQLYRDDGLRTLAESRARVQFVNGDILSLDPNSMAILKPMAKESDGADLELQRGSIVTAHAKTITASAKIFPKTRDTRYTANVAEDLSTKVEVFSGKAAVEGSGRTVEVSAGFQTNVALNSVPTEPTVIPDIPSLEEHMALGGVIIRKQEARRLSAAAAIDRGLAAPGVKPSSGAVLRDIPDNAQLAKDIKAIDIGVPIAGYRVQASDTQEFRRVLFDKTFDADNPISFNTSGLPPGVYWWRVAVIDLLGAPGGFQAPRQYYNGAGGGEAAPVGKKSSQGSAEEGTAPTQAFQATFEVLFPPEEGETVILPRYHMQGHTDPGVTVTVNDKPLRVDSRGVFAYDVLLKEGTNRFRFIATDARGNQREVVRKVTYQP